MIPVSSNKNVPLATGNIVFHVIVDDFDKTFSLNGPDGPNGVRLHYEMVRVARDKGKRLRDFDIRAASQEAVLSEMQMNYPGYTFIGSWVSPQTN